MKLYGHPYSNAARRVQMLCEECGIPYTYQLVDLMKGEQNTPEYLALNPNGKVPVIDDDGFVLWESQAIMRYLCDKHKARAWYPAEPKARARVEAWLDWNQTRLGPEAGKIMFNTFFAGDKGNPQAIEDGKKWLAKILPVMDGVLSKNKYLCGDQPTLADLSATTNLSLSRDVPVRPGSISGGNEMVWHDEKPSEFCQDGPAVTAVILATGDSR